MTGIYFATEGGESGDPTLPTILPLPTTPPLPTIPQLSTTSITGFPNICPPNPNDDTLPKVERARNRIRETVERQRKKLREQFEVIQRKVAEALR